MLIDGRLLNRSVMGLAQKRFFVWGFQTFFLPSVFLFEWLHHLEIFLCLNLNHYPFRALHSKNISPPPTAFPSEVFTLVVYLLGCVCRWQRSPMGKPWLFAGWWLLLVGSIGAKFISLWHAWCCLATWWTLGYVLNKAPGEHRSCEWLMDKMVDKGRLLILPIKRWLCWGKIKVII